MLVFSMFISYWIIHVLHVVNNECRILLCPSFNYKVEKSPIKARIIILFVFDCAFERQKFL